MYTIVDTTIKIMFNQFAFPAVRSVKTTVKFKNGIMDNIGVPVTPIIKAIIPGKKDIKVSGVRALCASLKVLDVLAIAIHSPLMKIE